MKLAMKAAAILFGRALGAARGVPILFGYWLSRWLIGHERAFLGAAERAARVPGQLGIYARYFVYRRLLTHVGTQFSIGYMSFVTKADARIGDRVYVGRMSSLGLVDIGSDTLIGDGVQILSGGRQHGRSVEQGRALPENPKEFVRVSIGSSAWIGANAVVMADVGDRSIVGAGAVVTRAVAPGSRVGGVPARPL